MGVVYRARHLRLGREVALKRVPGGHRADPRALVRFLAEAVAAGAPPRSAFRAPVRTSVRRPVGRTGPTPDRPSPKTAPVPGLVLTFPRPGGDIDG